MKLVSCALLVIGLWGLPHRSLGQVRYQAEQFLAMRAIHDKPPRILTQQTLFPKAVLQNPMNFAPLCRLELKIERQSPVGIWVRADGATYRQVTNPGLAYLRLKVPLHR